jgi:hypothetical protein
MAYSRLPSMQDRESLVLANRGDGRVVLAPVYLNGQERMALAYMEQTPQGAPYLRIIGVCIDEGDRLTNKDGTPAGIMSLAHKQELN